MTIRSRFIAVRLTVVLILAGLALAGCGGAGNGDKGNAATVNGKAITMAEFNEQVALVRESLIGQGLDADSVEGKETIEQMRSDLLQQMIDIELIRQAATDEGVTVSDADVKTRLAQIKTDAGGDAAFKKSLEESKLTEAQFIKLILRDQMIYEQLYDKLVAKLPATAEQVRVRHILLNTEKEASNAQARLSKGENFAVVAKEISLDTSTKDNGGDLGFFPRGVLDATFEELAFKLKVNEVGSVKTDYGYHVMQLLEKEASRAIAAEIKQYLGDEAINVYVEGLRSKATVEIIAKFPATPTPSQ